MEIAKRSLFPSSIQWYRFCVHSFYCVCRLCYKMYFQPLNKPAYDMINQIVTFCPGALTVQVFFFKCKTKEDHNLVAA